MKKYILLLILSLIGLVGIALFFFYFSHHDSKALIEFSAAYENYDRAISGFSNAVFTSHQDGSPVTEGLEQNADQAFAVLNAKAAVGISSLTRHDAEIMNITQEIADISGRELAVIKEYQGAISSEDIDLKQLVIEWEDLAVIRKAAFAHFQELGGD
jgi:hypothetical protein